MIDLELEKEFVQFRKLLERGLAERDKSKIGLRWPLASAKISSLDKLNKEIEDLLKQQLNVKEILFKKDKDVSVELNLNMTPELEAEGFAREIARKIQSERKTRNMNKDQRIVLNLFVSSKIKIFLSNHKDFISKRVGATKISFIDAKANDLIFFEIRDEKIGFHF